MKTLIISAPIGSGHVKAGQAVGAALQSIDASNEVLYANVFTFFPAFIGNTILKSYLKILSLFPQAYGMAYGWGNNSRAALLGRQIISRLLAKQMLLYINTVRPDVIVATHATPAGLIAELLRQGKLQIPGIAVITDFVVHRLWVYPELTHYCVANETLREDLRAFGVPLEQSSACGIPVDMKFAANKSKASIALQCGLDPSLPIVMFMGGGDGLLPLDKLVIEIDKLNLSFQMLAVCGKNQSLFARLSCFTGMQHQLHVYDFIDNVAELMAASDLLITKPGGMTSAEALCCGLPLVLYRPIPGQEEANANRLLQLGCAVQANSLEALVETVSALLLDSAKRDELSQAAHRAAKANASYATAQIIRQLAIS